MALSPQSQAVVDKLLAGQSVGMGENAVGPLSETARTLLKVFVDKFSDLQGRSGDDRAKHLRDFFNKATASPSQQPDNASASEPSIVEPQTAQNWKLMRLRCESIRGIAAPKEIFEFDFNGSSNLIYGPNGSGKSSLLAALVWVLIGSVVTDATDSETEAPVYEGGAELSAGKKIRDWPIIVTLPLSGNIINETANCWGEIWLKRPRDEKQVFLHRSLNSTLQVSFDRTNWSPIHNLSQIGVEPIDIQLSIFAPTVFGRRAIEDAESTRSILSLMLGFDDIEKLGELASATSGNRTRLANAEKAELDRRESALAESISTLPQQLANLTTVGTVLGNAKTAQATIDSARAQWKVLDTLKDALDELKELSKFAERAVRGEFNSIKDSTSKHLRNLYPENPTGVQAGKVRLGSGRDKSVEALLSAKLFDVPGQYFANAGLQRAVALSFYFALLEKHRSGFGFVVMDDPILSLDEDHRERWSEHVLRPKLGKFQFILATHQRQFLKNCAQDFDNEQIIELNPRDHQRRISHKPGNRLACAETQLSGCDWLAGVPIMRKFREDVLISMDAYSPALSDKTL